MAFQLYCRYFEYRKANESLFANFTASEMGIKQALLDGFPGVLDSPDQQGRRVLVFFTAHWDHCRYGLLAIYRALLLTLENLVDDETTQIHGFLLIIDWSGFTFRQSSLLQPKLLRLIIEGLQVNPNVEQFCVFIPRGDVLIRIFNCRIAFLVVLLVYILLINLGTLKLL